MPVSDDLVAERFWTLVGRCQDPMHSRSFVSPARKRVTVVTANVLTMHPAQVSDSDPSLFSAHRLQLSLCVEGKTAHLVGVQEWTALGQCGCELWVSSNIATAKALCLLHADPRRLMVTLHLLQQFFILRTGIMVKMQFPFGGKKLWTYSSASVPLGYVSLP